MKTIKRKRRTIEVTYYVSFDGREFLSEKECTDWENLVVTHKRTCFYCKGEKRIYKGQEKVPVEPESQNLDDGMRDLYEDCPVCHGKGWILP